MSERLWLIEVFAPIRDAGRLARLRIAYPRLFPGESESRQTVDDINDFMLGDAV